MNAENARQISHYVIVGGGTSGWTSAAILAHTLKYTNCRITLVESPDTPTVGVGEATVPSMVDLLSYLHIPFKEFVRDTSATFKLAIKFNDWYKKGESFWNPFGLIGSRIDGKPFYQHWLKYRSGGGNLDYIDFSPSVAMARQNKFFIPDPKKKSNLSSSSYAFHFDAALVAEKLKQYCLSLNVAYVSDHIDQTLLSDEGDVSALLLRSGDSLSADFFIDCSGQNAILIEKALGVPFDDWQEYLPANRATVVQSKSNSVLKPYTESTALSNGWCWEIPLQNRTGNGFVYSSDFCDEEGAIDTLRQQLGSEAITDFRTLMFKTGKRKQMWFKNCLSVGLASGFVEPLESTSIHMIIRAMLEFVQVIPHRKGYVHTQQEYNRLMDEEYLAIRDFIVMHYCTSARQDSPFWLSWKERKLPASLETKLALFSEYGRLQKNERDFFSQDSWYAVLEGMKVRPVYYDPVIDASDEHKIRLALESAKLSLEKNASVLLDHKTFLNEVVLS